MKEIRLGQSVTLTDGRTGVIAQIHRINGEPRSVRIRLTTGIDVVVKLDEIR